jgi:hypothetical protein
MPELRPVDREPEEGHSEFSSKSRWSAKQKMDPVMRML